MNEKLLELFNYFKNLKCVQTIVEEILTLDHYVYNFEEETAIDLIDYCIDKYKREIMTIGSLYKNKVVIDNDPHVYETKDSIEINEDAEFIRDCLIIIGAVRSEIRPSIQAVIAELNDN